MFFEICSASFAVGLHTRRRLTFPEYGRVRRPGIEEAPTIFRCLDEVSPQLRLQKAN